MNRLNSSEVINALKKADMVMITIGGNDVMKVVRENFSTLKLKDFEQQRQQFAIHLSDILTTIRTQNKDTSIVLIGLYNPFLKWFSDIEEMNQITQSWNETSKQTLADFDDSYFIDFDDIFMNSDEDLLYTDYFNPNNRGYELIGERIFERLKIHALNTLMERKLAGGKKELQNDHE